MTLSELIDQLTALAEEHEGEDPDVVVAYQPSWPMEVNITDIVAVDPAADELAEMEQALSELEDDEDEDRAGIKDAMADVQHHAKPKAIVIGTAWNNEYLRSGGAAALGWR